MAVGIEQRHGRRCRGGRCSCPWQASVYSKRDGKKIRKLFPTRAEAESWRDDARAAVRKRTLRAPSPLTLAQAAAAWLDGAREGVIRPRSGHPYKPAAIRHYERGLRLRVLPALGDRRLAEIDREQLQRFVDQLVAEGASAALVEATMSPVRAIYRQAARNPSTGVAVNPTDGLELPVARGRRERIAGPAECATLLAALPDRDRALWATAIYAGLRRGELMALRVGDVDLQAGIIHVRRGWDQHEGEIETKSRKPRKVPIAAALRAHMAAHLLALGWSDGLVFGIGPADPLVVTSVLFRARRAWGWSRVTRTVGDRKRQEWVRGEDALDPIGLHECRHTFASLMIAAGVNAKALSAYMGHSNIGITMDRYGHLMPGNEDEAAGLLDTYLRRAV